MLKTAAVASLSLFILGSPAADPPPVVLSAYVTQDALVSFDSPRELPWDSMVPQALRQAALDADPERRRRLFDQRDDYGSSTEVPFPLPLPPSLQDHHYYLLDSTGVYEVRPTHLLGTARIRWADSTPRISAIQAFGTLQAPSRPAGHGGFILVTERPVTLHTERSQLTADALLAPHGGTYPGQGTAFRQIVHQYLVRQTAPSPHRWVWVQWQPDTAMFEIGCTFRFALFDWQTEPTPTATTDDGCDV
jgi:hypothetical protein